MNNYPVNDHDIQRESKTCSDIYDVLAHPAIFKPLISCVFPGFIEKDINKDLLRNYAFINRSKFLWNEENIIKIIDFFKNEEM